MLIEFSVANFLSIKDRQTLRMDAASISDYPERVIDAGRNKLLRSAAIYGANASGKSNMLRAMGTMRYIITSSAKRSSTDEIEVNPFLLNTETEHAPSYFEVVFLIQSIVYRYGFEADSKDVRAEWLFETVKSKERLLFLRQETTIDVARSFKEGKGLELKTGNNSLFLAVCDQFNGPLSKSLIAWFKRFLYISAIEHDIFRSTLYKLFDAPPVQMNLTSLIGKLNLGFTEVSLQKAAISKDYLSRMSETDQLLFYNLLKGEQTIAIKTRHSKFDSKNQFVNDVEFDLTKNESSGTNKLFDLLAPIYVALTDQSILIIDELDAKLHPLLTQAIIRLFNDPATNPNNAQLIFATHDTNLLTYGQFRRDQIWFTEKDKYGATCLYSLVEYQEEDGTKVRKDRSFETDYIQGRYGAIPYIGDFSKLFQNGPQQEN